MPTTRAPQTAARAAARQLDRAADGRPGPRAVPANARPRHRCGGADVPAFSATLRSSQEGTAVLSEVVTLGGQRPVCLRGGGARRPRHHGSCGLHRQGVARRRVRAHHRGAHRHRQSGGGAAGRRALRQRLDDRTVKLWTLDGALERTFEVGSEVRCAAALPDGVHFVVGLAPNRGEVRLYHVDGTLVHTFKGHTKRCRGGGDARRPAHHQRLARHASSRCGASPARAL